MLDVPAVWVTIEPEISPRPPHTFSISLSGTHNIIKSELISSAVFMLHNAPVVSASDLAESADLDIILSTLIPDLKNAFARAFPTLPAPIIVTLPAKNLSI